MSTERFNIIFKNYPERVMVAEKRRGKLWEMKDLAKVGPRLQKRINDGEVLFRKYKKKTALYDKINDEFLFQNPIAAGTPRMVKINAQDLWSAGQGMSFTRVKIKDYLKAWFVPGIVRQMPEQIFTKPGVFIQFEYIFFYPFAEKHKWFQYQDYLNHAFIYSKVFEDALVEAKVIVNDGPQYCRGGYARYVDIMELEGQQDRRLEIKIHFCTNNERIS